MSRRLPALVIGLVFAAALVLNTRASIVDLRISAMLWVLQSEAQAAMAGGPRSDALFRSAVMIARDLEELGPDRVEVQAARGDLYLVLGRHDRAREAYERALAIQPRPELYFNLALVEDAAGESATAREHATVAVRLNPKLWAELPVQLQDGIEPPRGPKRSRRRAP